MRLPQTIAAGAAIIAAILLATPASAAVATTNVNVRSTPNGTVVDVLRQGQRAEIVGKSGSWCEVRKSGPDGWVACRYLSNEGDEIVVSPSRPDVDVSLSFSVPGFSFTIGDGDFNRPGRPGNNRGRVCFYEDVNFGGDSFCARPGERLRSLGEWNDTISSIRVSGGAEALGCEHDNFRGRCILVDRNVRDLGRRGNDIISSIRVR